DAPEGGALLRVCVPLRAPRGCPVRPDVEPVAPDAAAYDAERDRVDAAPPQGDEGAGPPALEGPRRPHELGAALRSMEVARNHAERMIQIKTNFLGLVSHELRTPIHTLKLGLELIRQQWAPRSGVRAVDRSLIDRLDRSADRLAELVEGLLQHAGAE